MRLEGRARTWETSWPRPRFRHCRLIGVPWVPVAASLRTRCPHSRALVVLSSIAPGHFPSSVLVSEATVHRLSSYRDGGSVSGIRWAEVLDLVIQSIFHLTRVC